MSDNTQELPKLPSGERNEWPNGFSDLYTAAQMREYALTAIASLPQPKNPKLLGWRRSDYLDETADIDIAKNWAVHHDLLPIFEGDLHTKLTAPAQPSASQEIIAGALFDLMGDLTSGENKYTFSTYDDATPAVQAIQRFAEKRGLSLDNPKISDWHNFLEAQPNEEIRECNECEWSGPLSETLMLGSVGPLCPNCRETTGEPAQPSAEKVEKIENWHEDFGDVFCLHFEDFESSPEAIISSPLCSGFEDFGEGYWTHFFRFDFNAAIRTAIAQSKQGGV